MLKYGDVRTSTFFADPVDGADVGMVERGRGRRLPPETLQCRYVAGKAIRQKLERYKPAQERVFCLVHYSHATDADLL